MVKILKKVSPKVRPKTIKRDEQIRKGPNIAAAYGMRVTNKGPNITGNGSIVRVQHREFLLDVVGSSNFSSFVLSINPGLSQVFPWLSRLASSFEKYQFKSLKFCFASSSGSTGVGSVMTAIDIDTLDLAPPGKTQMMAQQGASRANVWESCCSSLPEKTPELYTRVAAVPFGADGKTYDAGNFVFATAGTTGNIGELYVEYDVYLHVPQLSNTNASLSMKNTAATSNAAGLFGTLSLPIFDVGLSQLTFLLDGTINRFGFVCQQGDCFLFVLDVVGTGITGINITSANTAGSTGTVLGPISSTITATRATAAIAIQCNTISTTSKVFLIDVACAGASLIAIGGATLSVSPWQGALAFF